MNFENELISGVLIKRYKRFFVDIKLKNKIITAHCPNPGSMLRLLKEGNKVFFTKSKNKKRKLKYTLQIIEVNGVKFCVNTHITNKIIQESLEKKLIGELKNYDILRSEKKFGENTRFDFFIKKNEKGIFIEVKNVTLSRIKNIAEFPDAVTERGLKHLKNLILANQQGYKSYLIFLIQIENCKSFGIAADIDPQYSKLLTVALKNNLKVICYDCKFLSKGIIINNKINFIKWMKVLKKQK